MKYLNKQKILDYLISKGFKDVTIDDIKYIIKNPADFHGHGRKGERAQWILPDMKGQFWAQQLMPNESIDAVGPKSAGITSIDKLRWYRDHIYEITGRDDSFLPVFSMYLSEKLSVKDLETAWNEGLIGNVKYYPAGGTTNSDDGLKGFDKVRDKIEFMSEKQIRFSVHGEMPSDENGKNIHRDKREPVFYQGVGAALAEMYKGPIIAEHISTIEAVDFVFSHDNVYGTLTPQHGLFWDEAIFHRMLSVDEYFEVEVKMAGYPSMICMPIMKRIENMIHIGQLLVKQHKEGLKKIFGGTDCAYHRPEHKNREGCACGVYNTRVAHPMYYMMHKYLDIVDHYQSFISDIGLELYGINPVKVHKLMAIVKTPFNVPNDYHGAVPPFAGQTLPWKAIDVTEAFTQEELLLDQS